MSRDPRPARALVLAAGFGTRMLPLTRGVPKPLLPVWGVPALEHALRLLRRWGVRDAVVNLHHAPGEILDHLRRRPADGLRVALSFEPEILGTGGALRRAAWFFDDAPFWLANADVLADLEPAPFLRALREPRAIAAAWLHPALGPRTVEMADGRVTAWRSAATGRPGTFTYCGLSLIRPTLLEVPRKYLPGEGACSLVSAYERAMADGWHVAGVTVPRCFWADIGTPDQYLDAHRDLLAARRRGAAGARLVDAASAAAAARLRRRGVRAGGFVATAPDAVVRRGARLRDAILMPGCHVGAEADLSRAVVGPDTAFGGAAGGVVYRADRALDAAEQAALRDAGWPVDRLTAVALGPRGSQRTFTRLVGHGQAGILIRYEPSRPENPLYAGHARFLHALDFPVPRVLHDDPARCVTLLEDLGQESVQSQFPALKPVEQARLYRRVLEHVWTLHARGAAAARARRLQLVPSFRPTLYRWEHDYFIEHFLVGRLRRTAAEVAEIRRELEAAMAVLMRRPRVLVHRDLQSSNILLHRGRPHFIDFQGMRLGPAEYDLASLLCDPYVELSPELRDDLLAGYAARTPRPAAVIAAFPFAAVQRLGQALGAFARLGGQPGTQDFARHIPAALRRLGEAAEKCGFPALARLAETGAGA